MSESAAEPDKTGSEQAEPEQQPAGEEQHLPRSLTFKITPMSLFAVLTVAVCVTPVAWVSSWLLVLYVVPLALAVWVLRVRTVVGREELRVRSVLSSTEFGWDELRSLRLDERRWVRAVLTSGRVVPLPAVRVRDLPRLAAMSGGRLSDPTAQADPSEPDDAAGPDGTAEPDDGKEPDDADSGGPRSDTPGPAAPNER